MWTGRQAKQIGLVDELGGLERALALAKERAEIPQDADVELVVYPPRKSILRDRGESVRPHRMARRRSARCSASRIRAALQTLTAPLQVFRRGEPLALMPNVFVR